MPSNRNCLTASCDSCKHSSAFCHNCLPSTMSTNKTSVIGRITDVCADCGSLDPGWAVVNRGVLICDECCSVHRSLGRHISQVKSLKKSYWSPSQNAMVFALNNGGANNLWEHMLAESKTKKKPTPKDPVHPTKADFIKAKHQQLQFVPRSSDSLEDLNQQLHSSVRTTNIETSLRLLAQGADPNYLHPEKSTRALHVAAKAGQLAQVELLMAHGADPTLPDANGSSVVQCARLGGHREVEFRVTEALYEVTDRLTYFLCRRRPDHFAGQHFLMPESSDCIITPQPPSNQATAKLRQLSNEQFEDLAMDVYDEVDRRETESIWQLSGASLEHSPVLFLPVNPEFSSMRNQGRQKLATCTNGEFAALVFDILYEAKRRQTLTDRVIKRQDGKESDDEPLYDIVASDEDYATTEQIATLVAQNASGLPLNISRVNASSSAGKCISSGGTSGDVVLRGTLGEGVSGRMEKELRDKLATSEARISQLTQEVQRLSTKVDEVTKHNRELRHALQSVHSSGETEKEPVLEPAASRSQQHQRPVSMYETREALRAQGVGNIMPQSEEVVHRTSVVTKRITELWNCLQPIEAQHAFVPCAERIRVAVAELTTIFPQNPPDEIVKNAIRQLNMGTMKLQSDCTKLQQSAETVKKSAYNIAHANRQIVARFSSTE